MISRDADTQSCCEELVKQIETHLGRPLQAEIRHAFLHIPRHLFIDGYYQQQGKRLKWDYIACPAQEEIYQDEPLVTQIDARGNPTCSSSMPSVMAQQLEALSLQRNLHVLEIGAGTAYNAALMSTVVKPDGQVVSVEIDEQLVHSARTHLSSLGITNVAIWLGDGALGHSDSTPYDRILATCGIKSLPQAWIDQLTIGGMLIANLLFRLASVFLRLEKKSPMLLEGHLLAIDAVYMEMHSSQGLTPFVPTNWSLYDTLSRHEIPVSDDVLTLLNETACALILQCRIPTLEKHLRWNYQKQKPDTYLIDPVIGDAVLVQEASLINYGQHPLAKRIQESLTLYKQLGKPALERYRVQIHNGQLSFSVGDYVLTHVE